VQLFCWYIDDGCDSGHEPDPGMLTVFIGPEAPSPDVIKSPSSSNEVGLGEHGCEGLRCRGLTPTQPAPVPVVSCVSTTALV